MITVAKDKSSYFVTATFTDENGAAVIPTSIKWSLRSGSGATVNSRSQVTFTPPDDTITIVLSGADLAYSSGASRIMTIEALYNSTLGNGLPLNEEFSFDIEDLVGIT